MEKLVKIDGNRWLISLNRDKQLAFFFDVPRQKSDWKSNQLWASFDDDDVSNQPEWSADFENLGAGMSIFKIKSGLIDGIVNLIKQSHTDYFYFKPTSESRFRVYKLFASKLVELLGGGWNYQIVDDWFYFSKEYQ